MGLQRFSRLTLDDLLIDDDTTAVDLAVELADYDSAIWPDGDEHSTVDAALWLLSVADEVIDGYTDPECAFGSIDEAFACYGFVPERVIDAVLA